jgi:hypothetical protein
MDPVRIETRRLRGLVTTACGGAPALVDMARRRLFLPMVPPGLAGAVGRSGDEPEPTHRLLALHCDSGL